MMIRGTATMLILGGFMLWMVCQFNPLLKAVGMDWVSWFMVFGGLFIFLFVFGISDTAKQYDTLPSGCALISFFRRDGTMIDLIGRRIWAGESFLDVPKLGLIEDLGLGTVFLKGRKKIRLGLENINYTPDPRHMNVCRELYRLGFDDSNDLAMVLSIPSISSDDRAKKTYYLEHMGQVFWNMMHPPARGAERLVLGFKKGPGRNIVFGKKRGQRPQDSIVSDSKPAWSKPVEHQSFSTQDVHDEIDRRLK